MRIAAVDIGTNSIHMLVAAVSPDGSFQVLDRHNEMVQLGRGEFAEHRLAPDAMARALSALVDFSRMAEGHGVSQIVAVATSAVREAVNGGDFIEEVARNAGFRVRVITGEEEGRLIYRAVAHYVDLADKRAVVVDIGGGSIELVLGDGLRPLVSESLKLGHIRLADRLTGDPPSRESVNDVRAACRQALQRVVYSYMRSAPEVVVGTSGTIEAFAKMALADDKNGAEVHLHELELETVRRFNAELLEVDVEERRNVPGLDERRAETIAAGGIVLEEVLAALESDRITVCTAALREGLILDFLDRSRERMQREEACPDVRLQSVNELLRRTGADVAHAEHVARLALQLFQDVAGSMGLDAEAGQLLHMAGLLHDIGLHVSYRRHHKHSHYLIVNGALRGFTAREIALIAAVARYHRKALPGRRHPEFAAMRKRDRRLVRVLAGLLRVADGLDRGHNQVVESVRCRIRGPRATFHIVSWHDAELELWGARRKADLFARVFKVKTEFKLETSDDDVDHEQDAPLAAAEPGLQAD